MGIVRWRHILFIVRMDASSRRRPVRAQPSSFKFKLDTARYSIMLFKHGGASSGGKKCPTP
jgi:hypothetical protein